MCFAVSLHWFSDKELQKRLEKAGHDLEWPDIKQDLKSLQGITLENKGKTLAV